MPTVTETLHFRQPRFRKAANIFCRDHDILSVNKTDAFICIYMHLYIIENKKEQPQR
jgi:hypothetical protein